MIKNLIMCAIFLLGLYFIFNNPLEEGFKETSDMPYRCPNILIQKGNTFLLYNSKLAKVPGVNPLTFNNLEDYTEFVDWQIMILHVQYYFCKKVMTFKDNRY